MSDDVETIMTCSKQKPTQLISDVTPKRLFFSWEDSLIAVVILNNLRNDQLIIHLNQSTSLERSQDILTYDKIRNQSLIFIDPRLELEVEKFGVTMLRTVFNASSTCVDLADRNGYSSYRTTRHSDEDYRVGEHQRTPCRDTEGNVLQYCTENALWTQDQIPLPPCAQRSMPDQRMSDYSQCNAPCACHYAHSLASDRACT